MSERQPWGALIASCRSRHELATALLHNLSREDLEEYYTIEDGRWTPHVTDHTAGCFDALAQAFGANPVPSPLPAVLTGETILDSMGIDIENHEGNNASYPDQYPDP